MKKYIAMSILGLLAGASSMLTSCEDTLDADKYFDDRVTLESVFTDINQTNGWLAQAFAYLKDDLADVINKEAQGVGFHVFADDIYWGDRDIFYDNKWLTIDKAGSYNAFKQGDYDENYGSNAWTNAYRGIFQASVFINNIDMNYKLTEEERRDLKGQARFVRAYYYWLLLRRYGPVPIVPVETADFTLSYEELSYPRASYEEVANFISDEMIQACKELSNWSRIVGNTDPENIIRPTRGAALATRALALTFAASPLANGQLANGTHPAGISMGWVQQLRNKDGKMLLSTEYSEEKWARAAAALRDVIESPCGYELYHRNVQEVDNKSTGYPKTITPYNDGDFSTKGWPEGYADIDPYLSYRDLFNGEVALDNTEIIFSRGYNAAGQGNWHRGLDGFVAHQLPNTLFGFNCHGVTQKMVDAYYMLDGTDCPGKDSEMNGGDGSERPTGFTSASKRNPDYYQNFKPLAAGVHMMYANREPRFYACVAFNGSQWWNANPEKSEKTPQIFYYRGSTEVTGTVEGDKNSEVKSANGYTNSCYYLRTGIGFKKWVSPNDWRTIRDGGDYGHFVHKWEPAIRYADILLLYAECINELTGSYTIPNWDGSATYTINRSVDEMKRGVRPVRIRAGIPDYTASEYGDRDVFRDKIKRERMIEFVGEGKRYYDLRRWLDVAIEEAKPIYGCNINMTEKQRDQFHKIVPIYNLPTVFSDKMYLWPIARWELKRNQNLVQNPGWQTYD